MLDLEDYQEEDLDNDLHALSNIAADPVELDVVERAVGEALQEVQMDSVGVELPDDEQISNSVEFFFSTDGRMRCPIDGCTARRFLTKTKYTRHWNERHVPTNLKYHCSYSNCDTTCRRRYDMKIHIRDVHKVLDNVRLEDLTARCMKSVLENRGFIDPGFFVFRGRVRPSASATTSSPPSESTPVPLNTTTNSESSNPIHITTPPPSLPVPSIPAAAIQPVPLPSIFAASIGSTSCPSADVTIKIPPSAPSNLSVSSNQTISLNDYRLRNRSSAPSDVRQVDCYTAFDISSTAEASSQTSCLELQPFRLPPIPETQRELEAYIRFLCISIDQFGRQREAAKQHLDEVRSNGSRLESERKLRRELEAENRLLKREISEAKWKDRYLFPEQ